MDLNESHSGVRAAVDESVTAGMGEADKAKYEQECARVKKLMDEYTTAREFDKRARQQIAIDRRYAAGTADVRWAVDTNLTGNFIDILVAFLYARNPDVSVRRSKQVTSQRETMVKMSATLPVLPSPGTSIAAPGAPPLAGPSSPPPLDPLAPPPAADPLAAPAPPAPVDPLMGMQPPVAPGAGQSESRIDAEEFARTLEIVISHLWKRARLKRPAKKSVRASLSVATGWFKALMLASEPVSPHSDTVQNDLRDNLARLEALKAEIVEAGSELDEHALSAKFDELQKLQTSVAQKHEASLVKAFVVDHCQSAEVQVSLDVDDICDYLNANWMADATYVLKTDAKTQFPRLTDAEIKSATSYFQRQQKNDTPITPEMGSKVGDPGVEADEASMFATSSMPGAKSNDTPFIRVIELWNKRDNHIYTMVEGVKRWAEEPFQPEYPASRFYPYFLTAFFEVDGERFPQSLAWRLRKLQDEYASTRSNERVTRERSIPGTFVNGQMLGANEVNKVKSGVNAEYIVLNPSDPSRPLSDAFAEKPIPRIDPRLYDTTPVVKDMEKISGVQEALQSSQSVQKTATQSEIEQQGFASRTTADRDTLESVLTDLAQYTAEVSLGALTDADVRRIAGPGAFWPAGMELDDLLTMAEVEIVAGTTGKPKAAGDREAWGVVMPLIQGLMEKIQLVQATNPSLAAAYIELLRETMARMGDDTDVERFIPQPATMPLLAAVPGAVPPPIAGSPPVPSGDGAAPPPPSGTQGPDLQEPAIQEPDLNALL